MRPKPNLPARRLITSKLLNTIALQSSQLAAMFEEAGPAFQRAVSASGTPQMYVDTYGSIVDDLKAANDAIRGIVPPPAFERTAEAYRGLLRALDEQVAAWPETLRENSEAGSWEYASRQT